MLMRKGDWDLNMKEEKAITGQAEFVQNDGENTYLGVFLYEEIIKQVYKMKVTEIQAVDGGLAKILTSQVLQRMPGL